jgi:hypothetical protein
MVSFSEVSLFTNFEKLPNAGCLAPIDLESTDKCRCAKTRKTNI